MKTKFFLLIITSFLLFSCAKTKNTDDDKLKNKLIGTWSGSEEDNQIQGVTKYWIQVRNKNGTYILMYTAITNCKAENFVEKGKWWIKDGIFYEKYESSEKPDSYKVEILDENNLKFKARAISLEMDNKQYEFTEFRQE